MEQMRNFEWAQDKLDQLFSDAERQHGSRKDLPETYVGEDRRARRARERAERKAVKRGKVAA